MFEDTAGQVPGLKVTANDVRPGLTVQYVPGCKASRDNLLSQRSTFQTIVLDVTPNRETCTHEPTGLARVLCSLLLLRRVIPLG